MKKINYRNIKETLYHEVNNDGLNIYVLPKKDFLKTFVILSVDFGSLDNRFTINNILHKIPAGVAHFLEHKLFAMEDGTDAMSLFSAHGANANAFTTYSQTSYMFSTTNNLEECIKILFDFVKNPHFTDENVESEKKIIIEELMMYQDFPDWNAQSGLIKNMYFKHSITNDILGDKKSINKITKEILYDCYNAFYHPENMSLFIIGNCDEEIVSQIPLMDFGKPFLLKRRIKNNKQLPIKEEIKYMDVCKPKIAMGLKLNSVKRNAKTQLKYELLMSFILYMYFAESSIYYQQLLEKKLINEGFDTYANHERNVDFIIFEGDTDDPFTLKSELVKIIKEIKNNPINESDFLRIKKAFLGKYLSSLNSLENIASQYNRYVFLKIDFFNMLNAMEKLTITDFDYIKQQINEDLISTFIILPKEHKSNTK